MTPSCRTRSARPADFVEVLSKVVRQAVARYRDRYRAMLEFAMESARRELLTRLSQRG